MKKIIIDSLLLVCMVVCIYLLIPIKGDIDELSESYNSMEAKGDGDFQFDKNKFASYKEVEIVNKNKDGAGSQINTAAISGDIKKIISLPENGANGFWAYVSDGKYTDQKSALSLSADSKKTWESLLTTIKVPIWKWDNGKKVKAKKELRVNKYVAVIYEAAFNDIYNSPEQPVIDPVTTYVYSWRPKTQGKSLSVHGTGLAIDINTLQNPYYDSTGKIVGSPDKYGVDGGVLTKEKYENTKVDAKYKAHAIYQGGAIVTTLVEKYTFKWGATFNYGNTKMGDRMHFSLAGDGVGWREMAQDYKKNNIWQKYYDKGTRK